MMVDFLDLEFFDIVNKCCCFVLFLICLFVFVGIKKWFFCCNFLNMFLFENFCGEKKNRNYVWFFLISLFS